MIGAGGSTNYAVVVFTLAPLLQKKHTSSTAEYREVKKWHKDITSWKKNNEFLRRQANIFRKKPE